MRKRQGATAVVRIGGRYHEKRPAAWYGDEFCKAVVPIARVVNILPRHAGVKRRLLCFRRAVDEHITAGTDINVVPRLYCRNLISSSLYNNSYLKSIRAVYNNG